MTPTIRTVTIKTSTGWAGWTEWKQNLTVESTRLSAMRLNRIG